jgi:pimeloyl-ACP methyl ester carboxylesterase
MAAQASDQRTFVLVHGAWHGGWCWQRVKPLLQARGHAVFAPSLTGLGDRAHLLHDDIDLATHVEDIVQLIQSYDLSDIVLVGHSYGGMVISGVAEHAEAEIRSLVFVDAFVPEDGKSLFDHLTEERREQNEALAAGSGYRTLPPPAAAFFKVNEKDCAWVDAKCVPQPYKTFIERPRLTGARERIEKKTYVRAENYPAAYFAGFLERLKADPAWRVTSLPCGHDIMVDMPERLAEILEESA